MDYSISDTTSISSLERIARSISRKSETDGSLRFTIFPYDLKRTESTLNKEDHFSTLPGEIILHIFQFLTIPELRTCALVSKFWLLLSFSEQLWWKVALNSMCIEIPFLERILNCNIRDIYLYEVKIHQLESSVRPLLKALRFESLQRITLFYTETDLSLIEEIVSLSPNLKIIELLGCTTDSIGSNFFREVVKLRFFEKLYLCFLEIDEVSDIVKIFKNAQKFVNLKYISFILRSPNIFSPELSAQSQEFFENFLALCPNLENLILRKQFINDTAFRYILQMKHLKELNIRMNTLRMDVDLLYKEKCNRWDNLQKLYIDSVDMPPGMRITFLHLSPNLEVLDISGLITHSIFEQLLNMKNLKELEFSNAELTILENFESPKKFIELRILHLTKGENFTSNLMNKLLCRCNNLIELMIFGHEINESIFEEILKMRNLEKLEFLDIKTSMSLNTKDSSGNYQKFEKLKSLDLIYGNPKPDPIIVESILLSCENLTCLEIGHCTISEVVWRHINSMSNLEMLRLSELEADNCDSFNSEENLEAFQKLTKLGVGYAELEQNPRRLEVLLTLCSNVRSLFLSYTSLTDSICSSIASMTELRALHLIVVVDITEEKITKILNGCPRLTRKKIRNPQI